VLRLSLPKEMKMETTVDREQILPARRAEALVERLAERMGLNARASVIFGEPVRHNGLTVIPVARARWGFVGGAGSGSKGTAAEGGGGGGGGGMFLSPVGYIELKGDESRFQPIDDPASKLPRLLIGGLFALMVVRTLSNALRKP
jgi:uncharacterized spore protein YtfJ